MAAAQVSVVRTDVANKPIDVMGHEEPMRLMGPEVVNPFKTLVVKAQSKITFTAG